MAFVVEDGSGIADANALIAVAECNSYHADRGNAAWAGADDLKQAAIIRATAIVSASFTWKGVRTKGRAQALAWPRAGVCDQEGYGIDSNVIPEEVKQATCEIALRELTAPGSMAPDVDMTQRIKSETIGPMSTDYASIDDTPEASRPVLLLMRDIISGLLAGDDGSETGIFARADRG